MAKNNKNKKAMPPMGGKKPGPKNAGKTLARLLGYVFKGYPLRIALVLICLFVSSYATVQSSKFIQTLIDNIDVLKNQAVEFGKDAVNYAPLKAELVKIIIIFALGVISAFLTNYLLVGVAQGVLKKVREDMFFKTKAICCQRESTAESLIVKR